MLISLTLCSQHNKHKQKRQSGKPPILIGVITHYAVKPLRKRHLHRLFLISVHLQKACSIKYNVNVFVKPAIKEKCCGIKEFLQGE
jgi:hypothetical protein